MNIPEIIIATQPHNSIAINRLPYNPRIDALIVLDLG